jgi:asparagine synthase (glutamine-hydrolysing)
MCGISGILRLDGSAPPPDPAEALATRDAMARRGPDGEGFYRSADGGLLLGHRRLAILDPSPAGAQPMADAGGRWRLVLNGEIYNFRELRGELEAHGQVFRSGSDTEVLLALHARHGLGFLDRLRGMYALALWDEERRRLLLARDPLGVKPLYYSQEGGTLRFASQVQALLAGGALSRTLDPVGVAGFLLWGSVPEPGTLYRGIRALPAGHHLVVEDGRAGDPLPHGFPIPTAATLEEALDEAVRAHLVSDVPVAVFLSAGLDSALVAALAVRAGGPPPSTFTLSFEPLAGTDDDEAPGAARLAAHLGTRHLHRLIGADDFRNLWAEAVAAMDQPSIDGFNTFLVARLAHQEGIKVALSGLGGDELLGSYPSFRDVPRWHARGRRLARLPGARRWWPAAARLAPRRPKLAGLATHGATFAGAYFLRRGLFLPEELPAIMGPELTAQGLAGWLPPDPPEAASDPWLAVHHLESSRYLRHQLLKDADWAGMASSVEIRVPLVDAVLRHALVTGPRPLARGLSKAQVVRRAAPELPEEVYRRPKRGFYVPLADWHHGPPPDGRRHPGLEARRLALALLAEKGIFPP